jgi:hypothetical protein
VIINDNKCAQQSNTHHGVKGEIKSGQQGRGNDKFNDELWYVIAIIAVHVFTFYHISITVQKYGLDGIFKA